MTKKICICLTTFLLITFPTLIHAQKANTAKLDQYFESLAENHKFMGSVSVFRDGTPVYSKSAGFGDIGGQTKVNGQSRYRIGSISKTFTAIMIFQAIEKGLIAGSDPIRKYFPAIKNSEKITINQLMNHRSGIKNFTEDPNFATWSLSPQSREQMISRIAEAGSEFDPDTKSKYSNSNYILLSYILESVYNKPYAEILSGQITKPLSLKDTYLGSNKIQSENKECNSFKYFDKWRIESTTDPSVLLGAGGIVSTPDDLNKFMIAVFSGKLVSAKSLSAMQTIKDHYGMGLFVLPFHTKRGYGHSGGIDGFHSMLIYFPEDKLSYAITSNGLNCNLNDIHISVLSCMYGMPFEVPDFKTTNVNPEDLDKYTGVYSTSQLPIKLTIRKNNGLLEAQATGQGAFPLEASSLHIFKFDQAGIILEFNPDEKTMILKQGGGVFYMKRE